MNIALCPGHRAGSHGAVNRKHGLNEHDEAIKVIDELQPILARAGHTVTIISGRLSQKIAAINAGNFGLAIDLHFNADADHLDPYDHDDNRGTGGMVMYCPHAPRYADPEPDSERRKQADMFSAAMNGYMNHWNKDIGGRPGWYWGTSSLDVNGRPTRKDAFLSQTKCPAFIPEPGYIDNNRFAEKWLLSGRHDQIAEALFFAIQEVFCDHERRKTWD